jgi:hypothetical protein
MTLTITILDPILNVTSPVCVPSGRLALETLTETFRVAFAFNVPFDGLMLSQFPPSVVLVDADQEPELPQLPMVIVCDPGSPCP